MKYWLAYAYSCFRKFDGISTTPTQDTNGHTVLDDSHQQPLYNSNGGQMLQSVHLNQLEMQTKEVIINFSAEFSSIPLYQQQRDPSDDLPHFSLVCS